MDSIQGGGGKQSCSLVSIALIEHFSGLWFNILWKTLIIYTVIHGVCCDAQPQDTRMVSLSVNKEIKCKVR